MAIIVIIVAWLMLTDPLATVQVLMSDQTSSSVRFGNYVLDRAAERLIGPRGPVHIGRKAYLVIDALARTSGRLLTKDELFKTVWDGTTVSESALTSVIKELRKALGDDRRAPSYIASVYGRGYRFLPEVRALQELRPPAPRPELRHAAERRLVTVMAVDLIIGAPPSPAIDPETLADCLIGFRETAAQCIAAAGGRVVKSSGDGILACFGWPEAHEDAAERAIHTGFIINAETRQLGAHKGFVPQSRIGIATGLVVVGGEAYGSPPDITLVGEAPSFASRLCHLAAPGTTAIAESTRRAVGDLFEYELRTEQSTADGVPSQSWRPLRASPHMSRFRAVRTVRNTFVGREHELSLLSDRWRTATERNGRTVAVLGEAGIGKSRLVDALLNRIYDEPHRSITWQCSPYHQVKPLYPAVEYLAYVAGIIDADGPPERLQKLAGLLTGAEMSLESNLALFAELLSIPSEAGFVPAAMPPNQIRAATIAALIEWLQRVARAAPLLFVLEDAHWIDATTLELLTRLVGALGDVPLLAVITGRPEFAPPWIGRAEVGIIGLDRLNDRDCAALAREIVGEEESRDRTIQKVVSRSDGNPLYVEELSAAVLGTGNVASTNVPDGLQTSLMARLDRLGDARQVAQVCSVLGRRFARPTLSLVVDLPPAALDETLSLLVEYDVVRPIGGPAGGRYEFKHALVRDAAYESMLLSERRRLHAACGRGLEEFFPDLVRTEPELLAQHFSLAGLAKQASYYAELAGDRATAACAFYEAIASYEEALRQNEAERAGADRDRRTLELLLKLGPAIALYRGAQDVELQAIYRRAEGLSRLVGDSHAHFKAVWGLWYNSNIARELDDAEAFADQLVGIAKQSDDGDLGLEALHCRWSSALFRADFTACLLDSGNGTKLYDRDRHHKLGLVFGGHDPGVCAFGCLGQAQVYAGHVSEGFASVDRSIALAERLDHPGSLAHGLLMGLIVGTVTRTLGLLQAYAERTLELAGRFKLPPQDAMGTYHLAWIEAETGDRAKGLRKMGALYDRVTAIGPITLLYKVMFIEQLLKAGQVADALGAADKAVEGLRCPDRGLFLSELLRLRGECLFALGRGGEGGPALLRAEKMARGDGAALLRLRAANSLFNAAGKDFRSALQAACAAMPSDWYGDEAVNARAALLI